MRTYSNSTHLLVGGTIGEDLDEAATAIEKLYASQNPGTSLYRVTYNCLDWLHRRQVRTRQQQCVMNDETIPLRLC